MWYETWLCVFVVVFGLKNKAARALKDGVDDETVENTDNPPDSEIDKWEDDDNNEPMG